MRGDCECQAHIHTAGITFNWRIEKFIYLGKCHNFIEFLLNFCSGHSEDGTIQKYVFATCELLMESGPYF